MFALWQHDDCAPAVGEDVRQLEGDELGTKSSNVGDVEKLEVFKAEIRMTRKMFDSDEYYHMIMISSFA